MGVFASIKSVLRLFLRLTLYAFILTLPITFFPLWSGISGGIIFTLWNNDRVWKGVNSLTFEVESYDSLSYWNVPGALSIHSFLDQSGPFHIPSITSLDWCHKLGFGKPSEHVGDASPVDGLARLDGLVRNVDSTCASDGVSVETKTKYWVYVTSFPDFLFDPWDQAFNEVLKIFYVNPLPSDTDIFYLSCASSSFLCGVWNVRKPTLVYFEVSDMSLAEQDEAEAGSRATGDTADTGSSWEDLFKEQYTYDASRESLHPIITKIIELPLSDRHTNAAASSLIPKNTLPTPMLQLRSILLNPGVTEYFDEFSPVQQMMLRFNEHSDHLVERRGTVLYYLNEADIWWARNVLEPTIGKDTYYILGQIQNPTFSIAAVISTLVTVPCAWVWKLYTAYMGLGIDGNPIETVSNAEQDVGRNMWDDMMDGFWEHVAKNLSAEASESAGRAAVTDAAAY